MNAIEPTSGRAEPTFDPTWKGLYRAGGFCLVGAGVIYIVGAVLGVIIGPPPSGEELYLKSLAARPNVAMAAFGLFALSDFLLLPATFALFVALKPFAKSTMLIAAGLIGLFVALDLASTEMNSLALVHFARRYAAAASDEQRAAWVAAASYPMATLSLATFYSFVPSSIGFLLVSLAMLKGPFSRITAYVGITATLEGIIGGFYVVVPALAAFLTPCLVTFGVWLLLAGSRLCTLGARLDETA
jgi:hypothetical protein